MIHASLEAYYSKKSGVKNFRKIKVIVAIYVSFVAKLYFSYKDVIFQHTIDNSKVLVFRFFTISLSLPTVTHTIQNKKMYVLQWWCRAIIDQFNEINERIQYIITY